MHEVLDTLSALGCDVSRTGSREICNPPPVGTDEDWLVAAPAEVGEGVAGLLSGLGFKKDGSQHYSGWPCDGFASWSRGELNLIVSSDEQFAKRHKAATHVCKRLNLLRKKDRIAVFQAVLYGVQYAEDAK